MSRSILRKKVDKFSGRFSNELKTTPNVMCRNKSNKKYKEEKLMDYVTNKNVVVDYEKNANNRAAVLAYDTLIAAKKNKERKEKKHA